MNHDMDTMVYPRRRIHARSAMYLADNGSEESPERRRVYFLLDGCDPGTVGITGMPTRGGGSYDILLSTNRDTFRNMMEFGSPLYAVDEGTGVIWDPVQGRLTAIAHNQMTDEIIDFNRGVFHHIYYSFEQLWTMANQSDDNNLWNCRNSMEYRNLSTIEPPQMWQRVRIDE